MAYNPAIYNPYAMNGNSFGQYPQQNMQSYIPAQTTVGMVWVDGETEAKARQIPAGATQFALWDINEPVIYIKSMNPMGIPNPLKKVRYQMVEETLNSGTNNLLSGEEEKKDTTQFVKKEELQGMKDEIMQAIREIQGTKKTTAKGEQG